MASLILIPNGSAIPIFGPNLEYPYWDLKLEKYMQYGPSYNNSPNEITEDSNSSTTTKPKIDRLNSEPFIIENSLSRADWILRSAPTERVYTLSGLNPVRIGKWNDDPKDWLVSWITDHPTLALFFLREHNQMGFDYNLIPDFTMHDFEQWNRTRTKKQFVMDKIRQTINNDGGIEPDFFIQYGKELQNKLSETKLRDSISSDVVWWKSDQKSGKHDGDIDTKTSMNTIMDINTKGHQKKLLYLLEQMCIQFHEQNKKTFIKLKKGTFMEITMKMMKRVLSLLLQSVSRKIGINETVQKDVESLARELTIESYNSKTGSQIDEDDALDEEEEYIGTFIPESANEESLKDNEDENKVKTTDGHHVMSQFTRGTSRTSNINKSTSCRSTTNKKEKNTQKKTPKKTRSSNRKNTYAYNSNPRIQTLGNCKMSRGRGRGRGKGTGKGKKNRDIFTNYNPHYPYNVCYVDPNNISDLNNSRTLYGREDYADIKSPLITENDIAINSKEEDLEEIFDELKEDEILVDIQNKNDEQQKSYPSSHRRTAKLDASSNNTEILDDEGEISQIDGDSYEIPPLDPGVSDYKPEDFRSGGSIGMAIRSLVQRLPHIDVDLMDILTRYLTIKTKTTRRMYISSLVYFGLSANSLSFLASMIIDYDKYDSPDFAMLKRSKNILEHSQFDFHVIRLYIYFHLHRSNHSYIVLSKEIREQQIYAIRRKYNVLPTCELPQILGCVNYTPGPKTIASSTYSISKQYADGNFDIVRYMKMNSVGERLHGPSSREINKWVSREIHQESKQSDYSLNEVHTLNSKQLGFDPQNRVLYYKWKRGEGEVPVNKAASREAKCVKMKIPNKLESDKDKIETGNDVHMEDCENEIGGEQGEENDQDFYDKLETEINELIFGEEVHEEGLDVSIDKNILSSLIEEKYQNDKSRVSIATDIEKRFGGNTEGSVHNDEVEHKSFSSDTDTKQSNENSDRPKKQKIFSVADMVIGYLIENRNEHLYARFSKDIISKCTQHNIKHSLNHISSHSVYQNTSQEDDNEYYEEFGFTKFVYTKRQISKMKKVFKVPEAVKLMFENEHMIIIFDKSNTRQYAYIKNEIREAITSASNAIINFHSYKKDSDDPYFAIDLVGIVKKMGSKSYTLCCKCGNITEFNVGNTLQDTGLIHCAVHRMGTKSLSSIRNFSSQTDKNAIYDWKDIAMKLLVPDT